MNKKKKTTDYVAKLKKELVDVDFSKKPEKVTLEELNKRARKARKYYNYDKYETYIRFKTAS